MQPGRKRRLTPECRDLAVKLEEGLLGQILRLSRIRRHTEAERIYTPLVLVVESLKRFRVTLLRSLDKTGFDRIAGLSLSWVGQVAFSGRTP